MRNIFDQYTQPENRLTHALVSVLDQDRSLLVAFLRWLGIDDIPSKNTLRITEQQVPGVIQEEENDDEGKGLPDAAVFDDNQWAVLFESKVQSHVAVSQLNRHRATAIRRGFKSPWVVAISVDETSNALPARTIHVRWQDIYSWVNRRFGKSLWIDELVRYMQVLERKMLSSGYLDRGMITKFDGIRFDDKNPYSYGEAKRLIRLLANQLQKRDDLLKMGIDPKGERRSAITGTNADSVWDFIPLRKASGKPFTEYPHLTISIRRSHAIAAITIPNGIKGGFKSKLATEGQIGFFDMLSNLEKRLRTVLRQSPGSKPMIYITQRHYLSQRSQPVVDGRLEADLRIGGKIAGSPICHQTEWFEAIYNVLVGKKSNIQLGIEAQFQYDCERIRSPKALDLIADSWKALFPLIGFAIGDSE